MLFPLAQISLQPEFALSLVIGLVTALGAFYAVKFGGAETERLVKALHERFDDMEKEHRQLRIDHEVLAERVNSRLRQPTQRFKLAGGEDEQ